MHVNATYFKKKTKKLKKKVLKYLETICNPLFLHMKIIKKYFFVVKLK